jgi:ribosomal-protein-alanine N-acetyltransferase
MSAQPQSIKQYLEKHGRIREMGYDDLGKVIEIELAAYEHPWTLGIFRDCIRVGYNCFVYERNGSIVAYGIIMIGAGEAHVLNLCVQPQYQNQGIGRYMLEHLEQQARNAACRMLLLEVRESNLIAIELYLSSGYNELGVRSGYYPAEYGREDAIILAKSLHSPHQDHELGI